MATVAQLEFATDEVLRAANETAIDLPKRKRLPPFQDLGERLGRTAVVLASLNQHCLAFQTRLIAKSGEVNAERYRWLGTCMSDEASRQGRRVSWNSVREIELGSTLWERGYWADAAEILELVLQAPAYDDVSWKHMWSLLVPTTSLASKVAAGASLIRDGVLAELPTLSWDRSRRHAAPSVKTDELFEKDAEPESKSLEDHTNPRRVNIEVNRVRGEERTYTVHANIGAPKTGTAGAAFREPNWEGRDYLDLRITLDGDAEITPAWRELRLHKSGDTPKVDFRVRAFRDGPLLLHLRVYTAREFTLLEQYDLEIEVARRLMVA